MSLLGVSFTCASQFTDFVARYPRSEYAPVALNDSAVIAEKAEQLDLVIAAAEQLLNEYPGAPEALQKPATLSLAGWRRYVERYGARPDAAGIAFNIGLVLERQKDWRRAADHWREFQRTLH